MYSHQFTEHYQNLRNPFMFLSNHYLSFVIGSLSQFSFWDLSVLLYVAESVHLLCCVLSHCTYSLMYLFLLWLMNIWVVSAAAKSLQLYPTLCNPIDGSPPGSAVPGILQARTLEWVAISFSNAWMWKVKVKSLSRVRPSATPWTAAFQAPPSMGFARQEYWSGVPLPSPIVFGYYT